MVINKEFAELIKEMTISDPLKLDAAKVRKLHKEITSDLSKSDRELFDDIYFAVIDLKFQRLKLTLDEVERTILQEKLSQAS